MDQTTLLSVAAMGISCTALLLNSRRMTRKNRAEQIGPALRTRNQLDPKGRPDMMEVFYLPYAMEPAFVMRRRWRDENAEIEAQGRLFHVPGPKDGPVHWDHADGWLRHADGLSVRVRYLRIDNRDDDEGGVMRNDAITIEFASQAEFAEFLSKLPAMPSPRVVTRSPMGMDAIMASLVGTESNVGTHG